MTLPARLLLVGLGWFPTTPGGMDRYGYELMQQLATAGDEIDLCGVGLPATSPDSALPTLLGETHAVGEDVPQAETSLEKVLCLVKRTPRRPRRDFIRYLGKAQDRTFRSARFHPLRDRSIALTNLADPQTPLLQRLWSIRHNFRQHRSQLPRPDAINLHFSLYGLPVLPDLPADVPVTFTFHGPWALESQQEGQKPWNVAIKRWIEGRVYRRCDRFIVLSHAFGDILHREYQIPWDRIQIVPGGVDVERFQANLTRQQARKLLGFPPDRPILFVPRRLVRRMGIDILLQAMVEVKRQIPDIWLAIAGKGALRPVLERQVRELGLQEHVKFLGYVPDERLPVAYQAADLTVVPSQSLEGFGLILLESLACGTPVLSTPIGGMPEILRPFQPALVTDSPAAEALADRLIDLLMGKIPLPDRSACREYAVSNYDWQKIAPQVREVLLKPVDIHSPH